MCDRGFHGSSSSSSTLGARGLYLKEVRAPPIVRHDAAEKRFPLYSIGWALARLASLLLRSSPLLFILIGVVGAMAVVCLLDLAILSDDPHR